MITKKICLLGSVCVGKTSLARRFIYSCFSDEYQSTIGVKIHKKSILNADGEVNLIVWDIQGEDRFDKVLVSFLKGLSGYILVVDITHPKSATVALELRDRVESNFGNIPYVVAYSKCDLPAHPDITTFSADLEASACGVMYTSAVTGQGVDEAFQCIATAIVPLKKAS